jgi:hypothetical protein
MLDFKITCVIILFELDDPRNCNLIRDWGAFDFSLLTAARLFL